MGVDKRLALGSFFFLLLISISAAVVTHRVGVGVIVVMLACKLEKCDFDGLCFSIMVHCPKV